VTIDDAHSDRAAIAAFLRLKGSTRCPTAHVAPSCASITADDRMALRQHAADLERARSEKYANWHDIAHYWSL
jgi:hypothetical protein